MSQRIVSSSTRSSFSSSTRRFFAVTLTCFAFAAGGAALLGAPAAVHADQRAVPAAAEVTGAELFAQNCVACHGAKGDGDGPAAAGLNPKPRKLSGKDVMSKISNQQIMQVIKGGGQSSGKSPLMPAFAHFSEGQVKSLVSHIRALCACDFKP